MPDINNKLLLEELNYDANQLKNDHDCRPSTLYLELHMIIF